MRRVRIGAFVFLACFGITALMAGMPKNTRARSCAAIIYEHRNYGGRSQCLQVGSYNVNDLTLGNDSLSSVKVGKGRTVYLFEHKNFSGRKGALRKDASYIGDSWNDIVSSIIVE